MAKKKILFVIESLACAGAEKSLTTLLNLLDYSKYEVDLQLFAFGGEFEELLPKEVNVLPILPYFEFCKEPIQTCLKSVIKKRKFLKARIAFSSKIRKQNYNNIEKSVLMWKDIKDCFEVYPEKYDVAIAYAQGVPTFYVADCIKADKKYAWVNVTYRPEGEYFDFINKYYDQFKHVVCVSNETYNQFTELFCKHKEKAKVIYDINDADFIIKMSKMQSDVSVDMHTDKTWKLLTVGRLANQKGYDIATEACRILKEKGISFCWFVLGKGPMEQEIRQWIEDKNIENCFKLLGTRANPYPYFSECDIYVQTSKFEGFGITLTEARMLDKPIITTAFDAVYMQIVPNKNGIVTELTGEAVAEGILRLMNDSDLKATMINNIKNEKKGNKEELSKFLELIEG